MGNYYNRNKAFWDYQEREQDVNGKLARDTELSGSYIAIHRYRESREEVICYYESAIRQAIRLHLEDMNTAWRKAQAATLRNRLRRKVRRHRKGATHYAE